MNDESHFNKAFLRNRKINSKHVEPIISSKIPKPFPLCFLLSLLPSKKLIKTLIALTMKRKNRFPTKQIDVFRIIFFTLFPFFNYLYIKPSHFPTRESGWEKYVVKIEGGGRQGDLLSGTIRGKQSLCQHLLAICCAVTCFSIYA